MGEPARGSVVVIGVGNELRRDDAAGLVVARRLADRARKAGIDVEEEQNDPTGLIERWCGRRAAVLIDAMVADPPGALRRFEPTRTPLPAWPRGSASTHAVGLSEAIELGRSLGKLPERVVVYAVGGTSFEAGTGISPAVAAALPAVAEEVLAEAVRLAELEAVRLADLSGRQAQ